MRFTAAEEAAADAMAGLAAMEPESWNEIDDLVQAYALLMHDAAWTLARLADVAARCRPLHPRVSDRMARYAASVANLADGVSDYQDFSMVARR